jgi:L-glyceraldehyde 3-phosphate reductase
VAQLVLAWTLRDPAVTSAIAGARSPKQIQETVAAGNVDLPADAIAEIEQLLQA